MHGYTLNPTTTYPFATNGLLSISQIFLIFFGKKLTTRFKVQGMFLANAIINLSLPYAAHLITNVATKFWAVFIILFIFGLVNGIVGGTIFSLAAPLPSDYVGAIMFGQGVSGIVSTLLGMVLVAVFPGKDNLFLQAIIFFSCSATVLLLSAAVYPYVIDSDVYKYYSGGSS